MRWIKAAGVAAWLVAALWTWNLASKVLSQDGLSNRRSLAVSHLPASVVARIDARYPDAKIEAAQEVTRRGHFVGFSVKVETSSGEPLKLDCTPGGAILGVEAD